MATFTVKPLGAKWTFEITPEKVVGTTAWGVKASEPTTPALASGASGLPVIGEDYPGTTGVPCLKRYKSGGSEARDYFEFTCEYDSSFTYVDNPLLQPIKVAYGPESLLESYFEDVDGNYAVTTAGEAFAELPKRDDGLLLIHLEKNVSGSSNYSDYEQFIKAKVNDGVVTIDGRSYAAGTLKTTPPQLSDVKNQDGTLYRVLSVTLQAKEAGWNQVFESRGLYELSGSDLVRILDADDDPIETAWPLNGSGVAEASPSTPGADIELVPYEDAAFSPLT